MKSSQQAHDLIKHFEGLRLTAYRCSSGKLTIGYGSRRGVYEGMVITPEEAEARFLVDLGHVDEGIERFLLVDISQSQWDAIASLTFNFGAPRIASSTLIKKLNAGSEGVSEQFLRWIYEAEPGTLKKVKSAGLLRRRLAEKSLFESGSALT